MDLFYKKSVPKIRRFQTEVLKIPDAKVKTLVLLDNFPAHPQIEQLTSDDDLTTEEQKFFQTCSKRVKCGK